MIATAEALLRYCCTLADRRQTILVTRSVLLYGSFSCQYGGAPLILEFLSLASTSTVVTTGPNDMPQGMSRGTSFCGTSSRFSCLAMQTCSLSALPSLPSRQERLVFLSWSFRERGTP